MSVVRRSHNYLTIGEQRSGCIPASFSDLAKTVAAPAPCPLSASELLCAINQRLLPLLLLEHAQVVDLVALGEARLRRITAVLPADR